jgi:hypothetical protein
MITNIVEGSLFTKSNINKRLIAEVSDFGHDFRFMPLSEDYSLRGLCVKTRSFERTGELSHWYLNNSSGNEDVWDLLPTNLTLARWPALKGWKMIVFND